MTKPALHIMGGEKENAPMLTILRENRPHWSATLNFGQDRHYNVVITVDPSMAESHAEDKIERPLTHLQIGGLDDSTPEQEITVYRAFGEDDLRWLAKACLAAAGECRRIENLRRKKAAIREDRQGRGE